MQRRGSSIAFGSSGPVTPTTGWRRGARRGPVRFVLSVLGLGLASFVALALTHAVGAGAEECPNAAYRSGLSAHLPDCRAYEQVTPSYKATGYSQLLGISPDGSSLLLDNSEGLPGLEGFPNIIALYPGALYSTNRTAAGWVTTAEEPPDSEYVPVIAGGFSDIASGEANQNPIWIARTSGEAPGTANFYTRAANHSVVEVGPAFSPGSIEQALSGTVPLLLEPEGVSADGSKLLFTLSGDYWPSDATEAGNSLYEYSSVGNRAPMLVAVNDDGSLIGRCGAQLGTGGRGQNAIADQGSVIFFTVLKQNGNCSGPPVSEVFARIDNGLPDARTVAISEPSKEDCATCDTEVGVLANATFTGASEDGSKAFFTTTQPLLGGSDTSVNIFEYDFDAPAGSRVTRVSGGDATVTDPVAEVTTSLGCHCVISQDGSHVYFVAHGVLTQTPNAGGEAAKAGGENLYVFEHDERYPNGHISFVAALTAADVDVSDWPNGQAETTPDGRFLVFVSYNDLTPDDTSTAQQVFEYDAQSATLTRVSKGQDGFNDDGNVPLRTDRYGFALNDPTIPAPNPRGVETSEYWSRLAVSTDGSYVFFQSPVGLTPQALGEKQIGESESGIPYLANNVYEYHAGTVSLISDGQDISVSNGSVVHLIGTDASGGDVFFTTADRLVGQDEDSNLDIYDARVDGGFPSPARSQACSGEDCQGQLAAAPTLLSPGSEFQAGGNPPLADAQSPKAKTKAKTKAKAKVKVKAKAKKHPKGARRGRGTSRRGKPRVGKSKRLHTGTAAREGGRR